jgi:hypothetical protein
MTWFLVIWVSTGVGFGSGGLNFNSGSVQTQLQMPSKEICEQVRDINKNNAECWAKPEKSNDK